MSGTVKPIANIAETHVSIAAKFYVKSIKKQRKDTIPKPAGRCASKVEEQLDSEGSRRFVGCPLS